MKRKLFGNLFILLILSLVLVACGEEKADNSKGTDSGKSTELTKFRLGIDTAAGGSLQFRAAAANGYFQDKGIEPQISNFAYGIDTINALLTGQTDTGLAADYALLNSLNKGDFVVVSSLTGALGENVNTLDFSELLAVKGIDKPEDIKGKRLGVAKGTVGEYHWARYLEHLGINEKEVKFVPYSTPDEAIVGVKKGDIDAIFASGALLEKFKSIEGVHPIDKLSSVKDLNVGSYLVIDRKFAEKHSELIGQFLLGIKEGIDFVKKDPEATADIAFKELKVAKEDVHRDLQRQNFSLGFTQEDYDHLTKMKQYLVDKGILKEDYDLDSKLFLEPAKKVIPDQVTYNK